jgi:hypothetical protein
MRKQEEFNQSTGLGETTVVVTRHVIQTPPELNVPYEGGDPDVKAAFPQGFPPSYGSGIAFKDRAADGTLTFYCLTDRGPNGDGPNVPHGGAMVGSKLFPAPGFTPSIGMLRVNQDSAVLQSSMPIRSADGKRASGLPIPQGALGNSGEIPLSDAMRFDPATGAGFHPSGIDSEAIAFDPTSDTLWITDEYGPFLMQVDPSSGIVQRRYAPGAGLPAVLAKRRPNRGMEGMTLDPSSGLIHAFLQSPLSDGDALYAPTGREEKIERHARLLRWVVFDPARGETVAMFAYPLDSAAFADGRTGNAKLGDVAALGDGKFVVIEQGEGADGHMFNHLMLVETGSATDIAAFGSDLERSSMSGAPVNGADWSAITPLRKTVLLNLNQIGWVAEKAEGLALVDDCTLAMTNDNDFGMKTRMFDATGAELVHADVTEVALDGAGTIVDGAVVSDKIRVARVAEKERALTLWLLRFSRPLVSTRA